MTAMPEDPLPPSDPRPPLGVGTLISEAFSILLRRFVPLVLLALVPVLVVSLIQRVLLTPDLGAPDGPDMEAMTLASEGWRIAVNGILGVIGPSLVTALVVQAAFDTRLGRPLDIGRYVSSTLRNIVPLLVLGFAASLAILVCLGFVLVPGLWLAAVLCLTVPAVVIERAGFRAMGRSQALTKNYRWPLVGLGLLTAIIVMVFSLVLQAGLALLLGGSVAMMGSMGMMAGGLGLVYVLVEAVVQSAATVFYCVVISLAYARLRELKDGVATEGLLDVF
ncbi:hypothetical protein FDP22_04160 [Paroceanicella profunda]|uniref:Glycerophosphoryl diester phosphodiesterase membrane domain-containing protein n=1 Tax=Paroceanicella profunda TaxID=2579971 RepID=A0A5B8FX19_9RHOB|nr:hypothetical protein [Paroceanicella profunda]QDL91049.1 hypothetical protein FDP22_04160 [Paroceanicella profunda]